MARSIPRTAADADGSQGHRAGQAAEGDPLRVGDATAALLPGAPRQALALRCHRLPGRSPSVRPPLAPSHAQPHLAPCALYLAPCIVCAALHVCQDTLLVAFAFVMLVAASAGDVMLPQLQAPLGLG